MDPNDINAMVNRISSIWLNFLRTPLPRQHSFLREIKSNSDLVVSYEQPKLLEQAINVIPLQDLYEKAETNCLDPDLKDMDDQLVQQLLHWFKHDFFTWVDEPVCERCMGPTTSIGHGQPDAEDIKYGAGVVELYSCRQCHSTIRFPRYNDPSKLLQTRKGRCGEWANCFTLCCRAIGIEARLVLDKTDHVWTEIYSTYQDRWIHCDACEDAFDRPLMYSVGWNKPLSYCIGFAVDEVKDVTRRYVKEWPGQQRRSLINEQHLADYLTQLSTELQQNINSDRHKVLKQRHAMELDEFNHISLLKPEDLLGRQSGSLAWRQARGEQGSSSNKEHVEFKDAVKRLILNQPAMNEVRQLGSTKSTIHGIWRLTTADPSQCGGVFIQQSIPKKGLEMEFSFRLTNAQGGPAFGGADGLAWVIQANPTPQLGRGGCDLGYGGIQHSLAVEFDTYDSSDRCDDPSANHISIHGRLANANSAHHRYSLKHTSAIPAMNHGGWITCRIRYLASIQTLEIALATPSGYDTVLSLSDLDLMAYLDHQDFCWIGFTASTGGLAQNHDIRWHSLYHYH